MKKNIFALIAATTLISTTAHSNVKIGVGFDQGFGVTAQFNNINAFVGDDGVAGDYIFKRGSFGEEVPVSWYIGGGAFIGWDNGAGVRLPLGLAMAFNSKWDGYFQVHPQFDFDHGKNSETDFGVDAAVGVRYRF